MSFDEYKMEQPQDIAGTIAFIQTIWFRNTTYTGYLSNGKPSGRGKCTFGQNDKYGYIGKWKNGQFSGFGVLNTRETIYLGCFKHRKSSGWGVVVFKKKPDDILNQIGSRCYIGQFKNNEMHGFGINTFKNGDIYYGQFENGKRHGRGVYKQKSDGLMLDGMWKNGQRHGIGITTFSNGDIQIINYVNDVPIGNGTLKIENDQIIKFCRNKKGVQQMKLVQSNSDF